MSQNFTPGDRHRSFSVVVCTRNRAHFLGATLDSVLAQEYPRDRYELIIVDNGSSDGTRALVERYLAPAPVPLSFHLERRLGASFARNLGTERARHEYVAFLDDDTVAAPGWLAAYDTAIRGHGAVAAGGPVEPVLEPGFEPPAWWSDPRIRSIFGLDHVDPDPGERVVTIRWPLWLGGCNSIYSKRLLHDHGGFRTDCGPMGRRYRVAEDIDFNVRLERAGVPIHYVRDARIRHRVTADRLTRRFLCRRAYSAGITDAAAYALLGARPPATGLMQLARAALRVVSSREPARTTAACRFEYWLGYLRQNSRSRFRGNGDA
jgi:glycosyltransferase involved in cell wall biosynthesis